MVTFLTESANLRRGTASQACRESFGRGRLGVGGAGTAVGEMPSYGPVMAMTNPNLRRLWAVLLLGMGTLLFLRLGGMQTEPAFGDAPSIYLVSAQSLAHGTGYRSINYPQSPPSQLYPVGYPLLLSFILRAVPFGPKSILISRILTCISTLVWVAAARRLLAQVVSPVVAMLAALACGLTPPAFELAGVIKADLVFGAFMMVAVVIAASKSASMSNRKLVLHALLLGAIAGWTMLLRTIGFTLVFGIALDFISRRRWSQLLCFIGGATLVVAPWTLWCFFNYGGTFHSYVSENIITWQTPFHHFWALASNTAPAIAFAPIESHAWWIISHHLHLSRIAIPFGLLLTFLVIIGWIELFLRRHVVSLVLAPYMVVVLCWWFEATRFIVPVLPLLVYCASVGAKRLIAQRLQQRAKIGLIAAFACVVGGVLSDVSRLHSIWQYGHFGGAEAARNWTDMRSGLAWISNNTPAGAMIYSSYPAGVFLFTGRLTLDLNDGSHIGNVYTPSDSVDLAVELQRTRSIPSLYIYVCERDDNTPAQRFIVQHPDQFETEWSSPDGVARLYKVIRTNDSAR